MFGLLGSLGNFSGRDAFPDCFFFQAEDGIRDLTVTGVQTCALPISEGVLLPVPGQKYTFGIVKAAQARGDFAVLAERGRRALCVHLGKNLKSGLATLEIGRASCRERV